MISRIFCLLVFTNFKMGSLSKIKWQSGKIKGSKRRVPRHDWQPAGVIPKRGATERDSPDLPYPPWCRVPPASPGLAPPVVGQPHAPGSTAGSHWASTKWAMGKTSVRGTQCAATGMPVVRWEHAAWVRCQQEFPWLNQRFSGGSCR